LPLGATIGVTNVPLTSPRSTWRYTILAVQLRAITLQVTERISGKVEIATSSNSKRKQSTEPPSIDGRSDDRTVRFLSPTWCGATRRLRLLVLIRSFPGGFPVTYMVATRNRATLAGMVAPATIMETKWRKVTIAVLEDERYTAMLSGDTGKLDRLLDDRLRHVHSSGHVDNKTSWMSNFGRLWQYRSIEAARPDDCPARRQRFGFQYAPHRCPGRGRPAEGGCTRTHSLEQVRRRLAALVSYLIQAQKATGLKVRHRRY
jgi:hypothetical protein